MIYYYIYNCDYNNIIIVITIKITWAPAHTHTRRACTAEAFTFFLLSGLVVLDVVFFRFLTLLQLKSLFISKHFEFEKQT